MREEGELHYLYGDHLGSTSMTLDAAGQVVGQRRYDPYGQGRWWRGEEQTDFGFNSHREESEFGLYDYQARYFSPLLGRFISADTIVPDFSNPQSLNRYAYVYNNPLKYIDPSGHCGTAAVGGGTGSFATPLHTSCEGFGGGGGAAAAIMAVATLPIIVKTIENLGELSKGGVGNPYPVGGGVSIPSDGPSTPSNVPIPSHSAPMNLNPELDTAVHPDNLEIPSFFTAQGFHLGRHHNPGVSWKSQRKGSKGGRTTIIDGTVDVSADVAAINAGQANVLSPDRFEVNGRIYGHHNDGRLGLFPVSGPGIHQISNQEWQILRDLKMGDQITIEHQLANGVITQSQVDRVQQILDTY